MGIDILKASKNITRKYADYLKTIFRIDDEKYRSLFEKQIADGNRFAKGPYIDVVDSFRSGADMMELVKEGVVHRDTAAFAPKRLYKHQEQAIRKAAAGKNIVVSTGTGSGKTESFLLPILNHLMQEKENGTLTPGVRALIIYPMNALANDQTKHLRELLAGTGITFGSYTGQTKETESEAQRKYHELNNTDDGKKDPLKNELISRERMRISPPHILITNYSMLEYLLIRPKDNSLFDGEHGTNLRFVVLDEAHTYAGSTGIEVAMLLRRLKASLNNDKIQFILTSATLGGGDDNEQAARFAQNLCSAKFYPEDVIMAERIKLDRSNIKHSFGPQDFKRIYDIATAGYPEEKMVRLLQDYTGDYTDSADSGEYLFRFLSQDGTFWKVKDFLASPKTVKNVCRYMNWNEDEFADFVNLASLANSRGKKVFDARYHMFLRAADGVFITLGGRPDLSLTRQTVKYVGDIPYRYFEAAVCSQCHAIYLLGRIDGDYLVQASNTSSENITSAFLLTEGDGREAIRNLDDDDKDSAVYRLCPHCGFIQRANRKNKTDCGHDPKDMIMVIKARASVASNRVVHCISCGGQNNRGILRAFFSGQEAVTSVLGTALYGELCSAENRPAPTAEIKSAMDFEDLEDFDDFFNIDAETPPHAVQNNGHQFIAFSDSRQAAAYFATYFSETYKGYLYSRIIRKNILRLKPEGLILERFAENVESDMEKYKVSDKDAAQKQAWMGILRELISCNSRNSLIGMGLMGVDFTDDIKFPGIKKYELTRDEMKAICFNILPSFMSDNAITEPDGVQFTDVDREFYSNNGARSCYVLLKKETDKNYVQSFLSIKSSNKRLDYIRKILCAKGLENDEESCKVFLKGLWSIFTSRNTNILIPAGRDGYRLNIGKLKIVNPRQIYICSRCHRFIYGNVGDICPANKCDGHLIQANPDTENAGNHYYELYNSMEIVPLNVREHTAQLTSDEAYKLQKEFTQKEVDVLSCSTTFEMGVNLGSLETVFMRNMPPTVANYVQRAGRAGRSLRSAAFALTFCNKSSHDFTYFNDPIRMIKGQIKPPMFKTDNAKIAIRHLYASAIAFFFKQNPTYFGKVSLMFGENADGDGYDRLKSYLESKPEDLKKYLLDAFSDEMVKQLKIEDFGWTGWLFDAPNPAYPNLKQVYRDYIEEITSLSKYYDEQEKKLSVSNSREKSRILGELSALNRRKATYTDENILTFLSRGNIMPKYGFPVDTVNLSMSYNQNDDKVLPVDLSRDLSMALSEYAPGCQVVADGKLITSRYIRKPRDQSWRIYDYCECDHCHTLNVRLHIGSRSRLDSCSTCGAEFKKGSVKTFIVPQFGFIAENDIKTPGLIKPEKTYRSEAVMVSRGDRMYSGDCTAGLLKINYTGVENGEMAILNTTDFHVCPACGYAVALEDMVKRPKEHKNSRGYVCPVGKMSLRKYSLGYTFKTDAIIVTVNQRYSLDEASSILWRLILSACNILDISDREIAGSLMYTQEIPGGSYDFVIYDTTPGGSGHVRRFKDGNTMLRIFNGAYEIAKNCDCGGDEGDTSCYNCLRTYSNQKIHDNLKRRYVIEKLGAMSGGTNDIPQRMKPLKITVKGNTSIGNESWESIFKVLSVSLRQQQKLELAITDEMPKPDWETADFVCDDRDGYADLVWEDKKVMAFASDNIDSCKAAAGSRYECFLFDENVDIEKFVRVLK